MIVTIAAKKKKGSAIVAIAWKPLSSDRGYCNDYSDRSDNDR